MSLIGLESAANLAGGFNHSFSLSAVSLKQALLSPERASWEAAIEREIKAIKDRDCYEMVKISSLPSDVKLLNSMIILSEKPTLPISDPLHYKARFVVKGCGQVYGKHYDEVWAPTMTVESLNLLIFIAVQKKVEIYHYDVCTAFLNSKLQETNIYVKPPTELATPGHVMHLLKAIYGLKQAGRAWYLEVVKVFQRCGLTQSRADPCIFSLPPSGSRFGSIGIHVDDFLVVCDPNTRAALFSKLSKVWKMKNLGPVTHALGITFNLTSEGGYLLTQTDYIDEMLRRFGFEDCHTSPSPSSPGQQREGAGKPSVLSSFPANEITGSLLWATKTHPEIAYAVVKLCQQVAKPTPGFFRAAGRVLRWLKGVRCHGILFVYVLGPKLLLWVDADHAGDGDDRKSQTGILLRFGKCIIYFGSRKQGTRAGSSTEAEVIAIHSGLLKLLYVLNLISSISLRSLVSISSSPSLFRRIILLLSPCHPLSSLERG